MNEATAAAAAGKNIGVGCHALLQGIFPTHGLNPSLMSPALPDRFFTTIATWEAQPQVFWSLLKCVVESHYGFVCIFLNITDVNNFLTCLFVIHMLLCFVFII